MTAPARIGARLLISLIAGRASYRLMLWAASVVLAGVWGRTEFAPYAASVGAAAWLTSVIQTGPEKAALKLVPRARRVRGELIAAVRAVVLWVPIPLAVAAYAAAVLAPAQVSLRVLAAAHYVTLGCALLGVALYRVLDRPARDTVTFLILSAGTGGLIVVTAATGLSPVGYLTAQVTLTTVLTLSLAFGLPRRTATDRIPLRRRVWRLLAATSALMGVSEVMSNLAASVIFVELAVTAHATQNTELYLVTQGWSVIVGFVYFVQRVFQPRVTVRLAADGAAGVRPAGRLARAVLLLNTTWLVVAGALMTGGGTGGRLLIVLGVMTLTRGPLYLLASQSAFLLENTDSAGLRASAAGATLGAVSVALLGLLVIPRYGAVGALYVLAAREQMLCASVVYHCRQIRRRPRPARSMAR